MRWQPDRSSSLPPTHRFSWRSRVRRSIRSTTSRCSGWTSRTWSRSLWCGTFFKRLSGISARSGSTRSSAMADPKKLDAEAGFHVLENFGRFNQKNDIYSRAFWDAEIRSEKTERFFETYRTPLKEWKTVDGFTQRDYALRNASWHLPDIFAELKEGENRREGFLDPFTVHREGPDQRVPVDSPEAMSAEVKHVARVFGADLVGITGYDERWVYSHVYSRLGETEKPQELPSDLPNVIVIAQEMDRDLVDTVPSALSGTATGVGYSHDTLVLLGLAQYVINLGYRAVATMNDTALAIPYALKAGLGEYGRH
ncbi:MAG TPA: hypothetical protein EYO97_17250, partial [Gemmatimonadetes bacterium]|nr:hypothetical protein [Gemmatimonadota bacterium]